MVSDGWKQQIKYFDAEIEEIMSKLVSREQTEKKAPMSKEHGNYVRVCVQEKRVRVTWVSTHENFSDIMTNPIPRGIC